MGVLADHQIIRRCIEQDMISPYVKDCVYETMGDLLEAEPRGILSYGPSSYGYDVRLADEFKLFQPAYGTIVDVKKMDESAFVKINSNTLTLPPHSYVLGRTVEYFKIPKDIISICVGKSTYARAGIIINVTPLEPNWCGEVTLEIGNLTPCPVILYANEGICQFVFFKGNKTCRKSYADKNRGKPSKYQDQRGVITARV